MPKGKPRKSTTMAYRFDDDEVAVESRSSAKPNRSVSGFQAARRAVGDKKAKAVIGKATRSKSGQAFASSSEAKKKAKPAAKKAKAKKK